MRQCGRNVQTFFGMDRGLVILQRDHLGTRFMEQAGRRATHVAGALYHHARALELHAQIVRCFAGDHEHAAAGGIAAAQAAAQGNRLAGDHAGGGFAQVDGIGIHHPGHDLFVGVDVGRGDVLAGADDDPDLAGVAARQAFQFTAGQLTRIDADAALRATIRHVDCRVLDRHPGRQRHHLGQGHVLVKTHPALAGTTGNIVLHAIAFEVHDATVIHFDRHIHHQNPLRPLERLHPSRQMPQVRRDTINLAQVGIPGPQMCGVQIGRQRMGGLGGTLFCHWTESPCM